mgnify:CR=1 FL=1
MSLFTSGFWDVFVAVVAVVSIVKLLILPAATGLTVYWEHCGMLSDPEYRRRWELKQKWYYVFHPAPDENVALVRGFSS